MRICGVDIDERLGVELRRGGAKGVLQQVTGTDGAMRFLRGLCLIAMGDHQAARAEMRLCEETHPWPSRVQLAYLDIAAHRGLKEASDLLTKSQLEAGDDASLLGCIWHYQGLALGKQRQTAMATAALLESIKYYRSADDKWSVAMVRDTLGSVEAARGRLDHALQCYALALVDKSLFGDRLGMAITLGNLGRVHLRSGRYHDAIECFERDQVLCEELHDRRGQCRMHNDLGRTWTVLGEWDRAESELRRGIELAAESGWMDVAFYCRKDLASLRMEQHNYLEARRELDLAKSLLTADSATYLRLAWNAVHGEWLAATGDASAIEVLEEAVAAFHQAELPDWEIPSRVALAKALLDQKRVFMAERCLLTGLRLARTNGYARYFSVLNETMMRLDIAEGAEIEAGRRIQTQEMPAANLASPNDATRDYLIRNQLGSGGYGKVYRAYDSQRGIEVALKFVSLSTTYDGSTRAALLQSTKNELAAASRVRHPGVVRVYAIGEDVTGDLYICQELVMGPSLQDWMTERIEPAVADVSSVILEVVYALESLHSVKVVHRDLKPSNILLRDVGHPVLIDFGIAQIKPPGWFERGEATGTVEYMAPEQSVGKAVDPRADLYSLGVILYEWLAGRRPIRLPDGNWQAKMAAIQTQTPRPITIYRPDLPPALSSLIHQLLEKKPRRRPANARHVADQLLALCST